ncbi:MAG: hypothetical protein ACRDGT_05110 [Candidatus Limnocylindria bacterium]
MADDPRMEDSRAERDLLVLSKTVGSSEFPVERPSVIGVDRETGDLVRLAPFPWKGADTDPPIQRWAWINVRTAPAPRDPRDRTFEVGGDVAATGYVDAKDAWRLRWPFVRPHLVPSLEELLKQARSAGRTLAFVRPTPDADVLQLPLRLRFRCDDPSCTTHHELPVLDWELHEMARATRERAGPQWATRFRETWGAPLFERFDVHVLVSTYAQAVGRVHVAGLFYPPRVAEDTHAHEHHVEHRKHVTPPRI